MTSIKISQKKAIELIEKSNILWLTTNTNLMNDIIYYFNYQSYTYYMSLTIDNNIIVVHNQEGKSINMDWFHWLRKKTNKEAINMINLEYCSSYKKETKLIDSWYCQKTFNNRQMESVLMRFINDNKEQLTKEELTKIYKYIIKIFPKGLTLRDITTQLNQINPNVLNCECIQMSDGTSMLLAQWKEKEDKLN